METSSNLLSIMKSQLTHLIFPSLSSISTFYVHHENVHVFSLRHPNTLIARRSELSRRMHPSVMCIPFVVCRRSFSFITSNFVPNSPFKRVPGQCQRLLSVDPIHFDPASSISPLQVEQGNEAYSFLSIGIQTPLQRCNRILNRGDSSLPYAD